MGQAPRQEDLMQKLGDLSDASWGHTVLRLFVGVNIGTHGLVRIGHVDRFASELARQFSGTWLPAPLVQAFGWVVPPAELLIGLLLVVGLALRPALIAGGLLMVALTFGICLRQQWEIAGAQLLYALAYAWLLRHAADARLALDGLVRRHR
jgi:thiosulfate dehydrogenase [quinone] large subunit